MLLSVAATPPHRKSKQRRRPWRIRGFRTGNFGEGRVSSSHSEIATRAEALWREMGARKAATSRYGWRPSGTVSTAEARKQETIEGRSSNSFL